MKRRDLLISALALATSGHAFAADQPWSARLLKGGFDGKVWWMGLQVVLAPKWKTYWRVPGEGGIAPQFDVTGGNIARHEVFYPMPQRHEDEAGMTIGYIKEVVFPIALVPVDATKPVQLSFKTFFGVCEVVCIPAQIDASITFDPFLSDAPDQALISRWRKLVPPTTTEGPVTKAVAELVDGKLMLKLEISQGARDIFVEGSPVHYFGKPVLMRGLALLPVSGAKTEAELSGGKLRITVDAVSGPVEQWVTVD